VKYLQTEQFVDADCSNDLQKPTELLEGRLAELNGELENLTEPAARAKALLDSGYILVDLERFDEAWAVAKEAFDIAVPAENWEHAVQAADIMSQTEHEDAMKALAHGIWLGVTYPIDPELSVAVLERLIEETPPEADGAAVASAVSCYIVDLRAEGKQREDLLFFTGQRMGEVARRHSKGTVDSQEMFDFWLERYELNEPGKFLPRLAQILDVIVPEGQWWFDRDELRNKIPEE
jgi:hypothetical protein